MKPKDVHELMDLAGRLKLESPMVADIIDFNLRKRTPEERELITGIIMCIGAHWPDSFVPEDELCEAVNEFLRLPRCYIFFDLIKNKQLKLHVQNKAQKDQTGCWLAFSLTKAGRRAGVKFANRLRE